MRATVIQLAARFGRSDEAMARARALALAAPADLVLLPEASLTGYVSANGDFDLTPFAEPRDGPTSRAIASLAREASSYVAAPLIERERDAVYNAMIVFDRQGRQVAHYRKRHPWYPETWAAAGAEGHPEFAVDGLTVTLAICFDLHFVEAEAGALLDRSDLLLFPSAWVEADGALGRGRGEAEAEEGRAARLARLSAERRVAVLNANWAAGDARVGGQGGSMILDASGRTLALAGGGEERIDARIGAARAPG
jgi:predicted amidohydrolase